MQGFHWVHKLIRGRSPLLRIKILEIDRILAIQFYENIKKY